MKTKLYTHKRKGGSYRIRCIAKGSGTLNATGNDELVVYHNELGQHFVRPTGEFLNIMSEVKLHGGGIRAMTDHELIELAARAAGLTDLSGYDKDMQRFLRRWNPLDDDYDAFRLAVLLKIDVCIGDGFTDAIIKHIESGVERSKTGFTEPHTSDAVAATRRSIVRAAAYVGEWKQ